MAHRYPKPDLDELLAVFAVVTLLYLAITGLPA